MYRQQELTSTVDVLEIDVLEIDVVVVDMPLGGLVMVEPVIMVDNVSDVDAPLDTVDVAKVLGACVSDSVVDKPRSILTVFGTVPDVACKNFPRQ